MTLILTTTCDYALLVAIADGAGFPSCSDRDIFLRSRLALHLPDTIGDLIPPSTIISAKPVKLEPIPRWRTTLVYFLSAKLLRRLKRRRAQVTLQVTTMTEWGDMHEMGSVELRVDQVKTIKVTQTRHLYPHQSPFNILKTYVIDKGDWRPILNGNTTVTDGAQIKVGLFAVEMPLYGGDRTNASSILRQHHQHTVGKQATDSNNNNYEEVGLEIHSIDGSNSISTNSVSFTEADNGGDNENGTILKDMTSQQRIATASPSTEPGSTDDHLNRSTQNKSTEPASQPTHVFFRIVQLQGGPFPYLQIGDGSQRYTFVLRLVEAAAVMSLIPKDDPSLIISHSSNSVRKLMQYTFSDWQVKHDVITKGNSWLVTDQPMCLSLQGHLHDLRHWLSVQEQIEVCLVLTDKVEKCEHTIGKSMVRIKGWCPLGIEQASFPIHDRCNRIHVDQSFQFARVVIQLGLVEGWQNYLDSHSNSDGLVQQQPSFLHQQNLIK